MTSLFANLKARPLPHKAALMLVYGLFSFGLIWLIAGTLDNVLAFRIFELLWFVHIVIIANQLSHASSDLIALSLIGLAPGLINNVIGVMLLR